MGSQDYKWEITLFMPDVMEEEEEEEASSWVTITSLIPAFYLVTQPQIGIGNRGDFPRLCCPPSMEILCPAPSSRNRSNGGG